MSHRYRLRSLWNRVGSGEIHKAPRIWQDWLSDTGSLTQKIELLIGQKLEIKVLSDCRQNLNYDEIRFFNFKIQRCRVREVLLCKNSTPLVMARSIIPVFSSSGTNQDILRLGKKPLGAVLFARNKNKQGKRNTFEYRRQYPCPKNKAIREIARLGHNSPLWQTCYKKYNGLPLNPWGRRTLYKLKNRSILVSEIFLPALIHS